MSDPEALAKLRAYARAARVEKIALTLAATLNALPETYRIDEIEDALSHALTLHVRQRIETARQKTAEQRAAADTPMDSEKPHE